MFKTKRDVDRHVSHILNRIREEKERNARGYQFAKLYYDIGDYESAKRYLQAFLSVRETVPQAHKLMGQVCEGLKKKENAIESYKRSLELEADQKDVILKICELYSDMSVSVNGDVAKMWIERAEQYFPGDHAVFRLKERIVDKDGTGDMEELKQLVSEELLKNPSEVKLHIKLLRLYIDTRDVEEAFKHAVATEKTLAFVSLVEWYECLADVFQVYQDQGSGNDETSLRVHQLYTMASLTALRLQHDSRDILSAVKAIKLFDEELMRSMNMSIQSAEWKCFLTEMRGQLFYLAGVMLLKKALKGLVSWKEASSFSVVCFLLSNAQTVIDVKSSWYCQAKSEWKKFYDHLYAVGCDRLSQGGHMIYSLLKKQDGSQYLKKLRQNLCTPQGKTTLYGFVFGGLESSNKKDNSYILQTDIFSSLTLDIPLKTDLELYDSVAFGLHSSNINRLVWLALQYYSYKDDVQQDYEQIFGQSLFPDMKYSMPDLSSGDPATLCQLDVQVFLYTCVRWASIQSRQQKRNLHTITDKPELLPACLSAASCSKQQTDWWSAVYSLEKKARREKNSKLWGVVMRGLETIRLVIPNALSLPLIVHIAATLDTRAEEIESLDTDGIVTPKLTGIQSRAAFYWRAASDCLDRCDRNQNMKAPKELLFPMDTIIDPAVIKQIKERVKFAMATIDMKSEKYKEALSAFEGLHQAEAAYYSGLIYRKLADEQDTNGNSSNPGHNSQQVALLSKSKTSLYQALDRLETERNETLKDSVRRDLDEVLCKLTHLESGGPLLDSILSNPSQNYGTAESETDSEEEPSFATPKKTPSGTRNMSSMIPNPSPTKVEVQLRALEATNTALASRVTALEETKNFSNQMMQEILVQLRQTRDENKSLRDQLQLMSLQGLSGMSMIRPPGTPQQPQRINPGNMSFGAPASMYDIPGQGGIPPHMAQYCYSAASPRPSSAYGQPTYDDFSNVDGEFYDPDGEDFYPPDQNLVQDWPFGHKAGVEGKSTITYSPQPPSQQPQVRGMNPANAGMFANALRGPSIQYGAAYPSLAPMQQPAVSQLPGPGYFSHSSPQVQPAGVPTQAGVAPGQYGAGAGQKPATFPTAPPQVAQPKPATVPSPAVNKPMMPPNAVINSQVNEAAPTLIPGSVGVPASTTTVSASNVAVSKQIPGSPASASSILSNLAAKHQEESKTPGNVPNAPTSAASTPQKSLFGGFSFTSTPKITQPKTEDKEDKPATTSQAASVKPFSGFTLTPPKVSAPGFGTSAAQPPAGLFGSGQNASFGSLASQGQVAAGFQVSGDQKGFASFGGAPLFGKSPSPRRRVTSGGSDDHIEEYEPNVDFKPVIQLPDLIEVKTGEEDEEKLFCERAKLFRFDKEAEQWKERGIGDMKILKHKETKSVRILMRREQVLKLCANHKISPDMKLTPMTSSDRAWVWTAMDFAEDEMKLEKLAVKFKSVDVAEKFKTAFETSQAEMSKAKEEPKKEVKKEASKTQDGANKDDKKCDLASLFKPKAGSWTCDGCYVQNGGENLKCLCCGALKPGVNPEDVETKKDAPVTGGFGSGGGFSFGGGASDSSKPASSGFSFGGKANTSEPTESSGTGFKFGSGGSTESSSATSNTASSSGFKFGTTPASTGSSTSTSQPASGFKFGTPATTASLFGSPAAAVSTTQSSSSGFTFGAPTTTVATLGSVSSTAATNPPAASGFKFGSPAPTATPGTLFGSPAPATASTGSLFGAPATASAGSIFGSKPDSTTGSGLFGSSSATGDKKPTSNLFGGPAASTSAKSEFKFGSDTGKENSSKQPDSSTAETNPPVSESLLAKFLSSPDSWTCQKCNLSNEGVLEKCHQCSSARPEGDSVTASPFSFGKPKNEDKGQGFQFGSSASPSKPTAVESGFKFTFPASDDTIGKPQPAASLGSGFNFSMSMTPLSSKKSPAKTPQPSKMSQIASPKSPEGHEGDFYVNNEGDDSHIHFEPVIELPDEIEVKTGEEEEHVLFSYRAKLFRFSKGEWKERGLGDVKVLYNAQTNKARIVMRREQILKLCCNHYVHPEITFKPMPNSNGRALVWYAMDFADGESKSEQFSIRFKTEDNAKQFENAVNNAKAVMDGSMTVDQASVTCAGSSNVGNVETVGASSAGASSSTDDVEIVKVETATSDQIRRARELMLPDHFFLCESYPPTCPGCIGCRDELPIFKHLEEGADVSGQTEENDEDYEEDDDDDDYDDVDDDEDDDDDDTHDYEEERKGFGYQNPGAQLLSRLLDRESGDEKDSEEVTDSGMVFGGSSASQFSFASVAAASAPTAFQADFSKPFHFQGAGKQLFGGGNGDQSQEGEDGEVVQGDDPHFEPVVPLPDLIDVKTGEEDETAVFAHRAKLFRFDKDANQWKEKGIGEMKILQHKTTGKHRLLLRREQVHKLACNHLLTVDIKMTPLNTSETSWCWIAQDFADGEPKVENLAVKFKTIDLAKSFKDKVDEIQAKLQG